MRCGMYCVNCGVKLADTEEKCPLCNTAPGESLPKRVPTKALYPKNCYPETSVKPNAINGAMLILFLIPLLVTFFVDLQSDWQLDWFWYVAGALVLAYIVLALPVWFRNPNPVIFVPCDFAASALYLLLINALTGGKWYLSFALPTTVSIGLIVTTVVVLLRYLRKGRLYIWGGAIIAMGTVMLLLEWLLSVTFQVAFVGWSVYPLTVLALLGGLLIFLAINSSARERMERKFFF